jgi:hypothetical protein
MLEKNEVGTSTFHIYGVDFLVFFDSDTFVLPRGPVQPRGHLSPHPCSGPPSYLSLLLCYQSIPCPYTLKPRPTKHSFESRKQKIQKFLHKTHHISMEARCFLPKFWIKMDEVLPHTWVGRPLIHHLPAWYAQHGPLDAHFRQF